MKSYPYINQNGKRRPQNKEWQGVRAEMIRLKSELHISDNEFRPLSPHDNWRGIENNIYQTFCHLTSGATKPIRLWQCLEGDVVSANLCEHPESYLQHLLDVNETIFCGVSGSYKEQSKLWLYEGKIRTIQKIMSEVYFFDEFYFISKKYDWLICINHYDLLIATGKDKPKKLKELEKLIV